MISMANAKANISFITKRFTSSQNDEYAWYHINNIINNFFYNFFIVLKNYHINL